MQPASTEVHGAGIRVGEPTPEQAAAQAEYLRQQAEAFDQNEEAQRRHLIKLTGSPAPNRAQRRAAEKRLRRERGRS